MVGWCVLGGVYVLILIGFARIAGALNFSLIVFGWFVVAGGRGPRMGAREPQSNTQCHVMIGGL